MLIKYIWLCSSSFVSLGVPSKFQQLAMLWYAEALQLIISIDDLHNFIFVCDNVVSESCFDNFLSWSFICFLNRYIPSFACFLCSLRKL